jgi:hypothetical protein
LLLQIFGHQASIFSENLRLLKEVYPGTEYKAETLVQVKRSNTVPVFPFILPGWVFKFLCMLDEKYEYYFNRKG